MNINVTFRWDDQSFQHSVTQGTTAAMALNNRYIRERLGAPANTNFTVNGQSYNGPLNEGDLVQLVAIPSQKA
jgi:hypothetical protein